MPDTTTPPRDGASAGDSEPGAQAGERIANFRAVLGRMTTDLFSLADDVEALQSDDLSEAYDNLVYRLGFMKGTASRVLVEGGDSD